MGSMIRACYGLLFCLLVVLTIRAQDNSTLTIPYRSADVLVDGFLSDWKDVPAVLLDPAATGVKVAGVPAGDYATTTLKAFWDKTGLYLAIDWRDDIWDIRQIKRSEAVFVASDGRRRDKMFLHDNLLFRLRSKNYNYLFWISPRAGERGPYYWQRLQRGGKFLERATHIPVVTPRERDGQATLEIMLTWDQLGLNPKQIRKKGFRALVTLADSDSPELSVEGKLDRVGRLDWAGLVHLGDE